MHNSLIPRLFQKSALLVLGAFVIVWLALPLTPALATVGTLVGTFTSSLNPSTFGQSVTFTFCATPVAPTSANARPPVYDGSTLIGYLGSPDSNGCSSFTTSALAIGTHHISLGDPNIPFATLDQVVQGPRDVPEGDTLLLLGGGIGGVGVWLRWQWSKRRKQGKSL